jgi:hypothetical protein
MVFIQRGAATNALIVIIDTQQVRRMLVHPVPPSLIHLPQSVIRLARGFLCPDLWEFPA